MKTFIALAGVVVGGVTITAATILTVWNFTAGLLMLAAAFTVLVFTAWLIRRREDRDELAGLKAAHAKTIRELADTREERDRVIERWNLTERDLAETRDDYKAFRRKWARHLNACPMAAEIHEEDIAKARSNR